jgi:trehalose-6-phosphate synthase
LGHCAIGSLRRSSARRHSIQPITDHVENTSHEYVSASRPKASNAFLLFRPAANTYFGGSGTST